MCQKIAKTYPATGYSQESNGVRRRQLTVKIGLIDCSKGRLSRQDTLYPVAKPPLSKKLSRIKAVHSLIGDRPEVGGEAGSPTGRRPHGGIPTLHSFSAGPRRPAPPTSGRSPRFTSERAG